jgi:hypothetical protein
VCVCDYVCDTLVWVIRWRKRRGVRACVCGGSASSVLFILVHFIGIDAGLPACPPYTNHITHTHATAPPLLSPPSDDTHTPTNPTTNTPTHQKPAPPPPQNTHTPTHPPPPKTLTNTKPTGNSLTSEQKGGLIFGGLFVFFILFLSGYLLE